MNQCYPTIYDAGPTLKQHRVNVLCSPGKLNVIESDVGPYSVSWISVALSVTLQY